MKRILLSLLLMQAVGFSALREDINGDGRVDLADLAILASEWLMEEKNMRHGPERILVNGQWWGHFTQDYGGQGPAWLCSGGKYNYAWQSEGDNLRACGTPSLVYGVQHYMSIELSNVHFTAGGGIKLDFGGNQSEKFSAEGTHIFIALQGPSFTEFQIVPVDVVAGDYFSVDNWHVYEVLLPLAGNDELSEMWAW